MSRKTTSSVPPADKDFDETAKVRSETSVNRAEAAVKRLEARRLLRSQWVDISVPLATIIVAVVGFTGTFTASYLKGWWDIKLARDKHDTDLILKFVSSDAKRNRENIRFLLEAVLISDSNGNIRRALQDPGLSIVATQANKDVKEDFSVAQLRNVVDEVSIATGIKAEIVFEKIDEKWNNAAITKESSGYKLIYTQSFLDSLRKSTRTNWTIYSVVAHEIGHIALGHFDSPPSSSSERKKQELDADAWSGMALKKLGATLTEALAAYQAMPPSTDPDFPSQQERLEATQRGWSSVAPTKRE